MSDTVIIIPARYSSSRFPGKPLVNIGGTSMIMRVYNQCIKTEIPTFVATDDERIYNHIISCGGNVLMTSVRAQNGTERCAEALRIIGNKYSYVINVQGDEPFITPQQIDKVDTAIRKNKFPVATLIFPITDHEKIQNSSTVKAVISKKGKILYFSRLPIPFNGEDNNNISVRCYKHIGIYGFKTKTIFKLASLSPTPYELSERLEQLRWLENGYSIYGEITYENSFPVDTPEDLLQIGKLFNTEISFNLL